jgi:hypothetical protein
MITHQGIRVEMHKVDSWSAINSAYGRTTLATIWEFDCDVHRHHPERRGVSRRKTQGCEDHPSGLTSLKCLRQSPRLQVVPVEGLPASKVIVLVIPSLDLSPQAVDGHRWKGTGVLVPLHSKDPIAAQVPQQGALKSTYLIFWKPEGGNRRRRHRHHHSESLVLRNREHH